MWNKFIGWYNSNILKISWFFIGYFTLDTIVRIGQGRWGDAAISLGFVVINYLFARRS